MKYVALLTIIDEEGNKRVRPAHLEYIKDLKEKGKVYNAGPFTDGRGGMVIYEAASYEEAKAMAEADPVIKEKVRTLELREWNNLFAD